MKFTKTVIVLAAALVVFLAIGCAARQTVKTDAAAQPTLTASAEEATPVPTAVPGVKYVVKKGDSLWAISSMGKIYQDPFEWPLLFKANRDQVADPDIIEVGQELDVNEGLTQEEKEDAVQKAKDTPPYRPHTAPRKSLPLKY
jgi:nucleoid-associated protein YgaU